ncbi:type II secretion system protein [Planctomycetota bacterium]
MKTRIHNKTGFSMGSRSGFTFVELLVTIVLVSAILPVAMRGIAMCTRLSGQTRRQLEAASLARAKITELVVSGDALTGDQGGEFEEPWTGYQWQMTTTPWVDGTLQQVDVTVSWAAQTKERTLTLTTLVAPEEE